MSIQDDWLFQQIQQIIDSAIGLISSTNSPASSSENIIDSPGGAARLSERLSSLVAAGKLSEAEDYLYNEIDPDDIHHLKSGLAFYHQLNGLSDKRLDDLGFPRPEIVDGLRDLLDVYDMTLPID